MKYKRELTIEKPTHLGALIGPRSSFLKMMSLFFVEIGRLEVGDKLKVTIVRKIKEDDKELYI